MLVSAMQKTPSQGWQRIPEGHLLQESQETGPVFSFPLDVPFPSFCLFSRVPLSLSCSPFFSFSLLSKGYIWRVLHSLTYPSFKTTP